MTQKKIAVFVGSLRKESFNRKMAKALISTCTGITEAGNHRDRRTSALRSGSGRQ